MQGSATCETKKQEKEKEEKPMTFDVERFKSTKFVRRTAEIKITDPDLLQFFDSQENGAVWKVQSLSAEECARANDAKKTNRNIAELVGKLSAANDKSSNAQEFAGQVAELLGVGSKNLPDDHVYRLELFVLGSFEPKVDKRTAVSMSERKPEFFYLVTNKVLELIGAGSELGE